ncbi:hypothetical protein EVAR_24853_1 [Eumeta japonica]|uniref:Uncharacterized protein n=1 Tax=Eumeta variegata TaxID=151549 RepID=A0A4C1YD52_EUMVA|nr:hypothetical protein EVAR_24853_1 [Eumeta japonica]
MSRNRRSLIARYRIYVYGQAARPIPTASGIALFYPNLGNLLELCARARSNDGHPPNTLDLITNRGWTYKYSLMFRKKLPLPMCVGAKIHISSSKYNINVEQICKRRINKSTSGTGPAPSDCENL